MRFTVLLYQDETQWERLTRAEREAEMREHDAFARAVPERGGTVVAGEALAPTTDATTVRGRGSSVTAVPFAETVEQLGGFYVVDAPDLDTVLDLVRLLPSYTVEVRPVVDVG